MTHRDDIRILGIHFGHDASLALFENGQLVSFCELERVTRLKHQFGVEEASVLQFLERCGVTVQAIDHMALSATQGWGGLTDTIRAAWGFDANLHTCAHFPSWNVEPERFSVRGFGGFYAPHVSRFSPPTFIKFPDTIGPWVQFPNRLPRDSREVEDLLERLTFTQENFVPTPHHREAFYSNFLSPFRVTLGGVTRPAFFVPHHLCHAWYAAYYLPENSYIVSHDGGSPERYFNSGGIFFAGEDAVVPVCGHNLGLGHLYTQASLMAGFDVEGSGKLMGLAAYGHPSMGIETLIEPIRALSYADDTLDKAQLDDLFFKVVLLSKHHAVQKRRARAPFSFALEDPDHAIALAANTQYLVEMLFSQEIGKLLNILLEGRETSSVVGLVGGFALNCPANTQLQLRVPEARIEGLPGAPDGALSIGSAAMVHGFLTGDMPRNGLSASPTHAAFPPRRDLSAAPYTVPLAQVVLDAPLPRWMARQIRAGKIFCFFEGVSEIGPRALGHRSILAHAVSGEIRDRVNLRKGREAWRPLAPMVREVDFARYFFGSPENADHMLFTFPVMSSDIPAVTHADGTARVQVLRPERGVLYEVLTMLDEMDAVPVIINTSYNVAGEPIVETMEHAVNSFKKLHFDFLVAEGVVYENSPAT